MVRFITKILLPKVITIGDGAFYGRSLDELYAPLVDEIGIEVFTDAYISDLTLGLKEVDNKMFELPAVKTTGNFVDILFPRCTSIGTYAFARQNKLEYADFPVATDIGRYAFNGCEKLDTVAFPEATTINDGAFSGTPLSTALDVSYDNESDIPTEKLNVVNFPKVTTIAQDAFLECTSIKEVVFPEAVTLGNEILRGCTALTKASFPKLTKLTQYAFYDCSSLTDISFPKLKEMTNAVFCNCTSLKEVSFPELTSTGSSVFDGCTALEKASFPKVTGIDYGMFNGCISLTKTIFPSATGIYSTAFKSCYRLKTIVLGNESSVCELANIDAFTDCYHLYGTVNETYNPDGLKDGYIYVPKALIEDYKVATNWSTVADRFRALEDYTVDGTTTGELDETKI